MSKVTTVLTKLGLYAAMRTKIDIHLPRISLNHLYALHIRRHSEWSSNAGYLEFQRDFLVRRSANEMKGRLPVAR
jgi:hypothetical protein